VAKRTDKVTKELCVRSFEYDPVSGSLRWKIRENIQSAANARWAGKEAGTIMVTEDGKSYRKVCVERVQILAHRIIWIMVYGSIPDGMEIDHENGDGLDNRISNLRCVTHGTNMKNVRLAKNNTSGFKGVRRCATKSERWQAYAVMDGTFKGLGSYSTASEAYAARLAFDESNGYHQNHGQERPL